MPATRSPSPLEASFAESLRQFPRAIPALDVLRLFAKKKIECVLIGSLGLVDWLGAPRVTAELDLVVQPRQRKRAVKLLHEAYPHLRLADQEWGALFQDLANHKVKIKVLPPTSFLANIFSQTRKRTVAGVPFLIPNAEMAVVLAFAALLNPQRPDHEKEQEQADFVAMVKANKKLTETKLTRLCDALSPGLGAPLVKLVRSVRRTGLVEL
ncbi:MAG TPA: hypothetical protein PKD86_09130 [Gemmatales bacterium]|nr:hypothetical protein [Gemmatales bacterium]